MNRDDRSIIRRLVLATVLAGLVTGMIGVFVVQTLERRSILAEAAESNRTNAIRTASLIDTRIASLGEQLALIAALPSVMEVTDAAVDQLATSLRVSEKLDRLILYDEAGSAVTGAATSTLLDLDQIEPWNDEAMPPREDWMARIAARQLDGVIEIAVPVERPPGTRVGWLVGQAPAAVVTAEAVAQVTERGSSVAVTAEDGTIISHREFNRVVGGDVLPVAELFADDRRSTEMERDGQDLIVAGARLRSMGGWVVGEQPVQDVLTPVRATTSALTGVFLAVIVAIVLVVILAGRRLLRPLAPLADAVERIGGGERGVRVESGGSGEVAILAAGFNRMANALDERQQELEQAELATRQSEERLRLMVEGVADYAIVLLDPAGSVRTWNTGARRLTGATDDEAIGRHLSTLFDGTDPPADPLATAASTGRGNVETWCRRADGSRFWAAVTVSSLEDDDGAPYGYAVILQDLTERRATKEAMEQALLREREAASELRRASDLKDEFLSIAAHEIRTPISVILGASRLLGRDGARLSDDDTTRVRGMLEVHADDLRAIVDRLLDFTRLQAGKVTLEPEPLPLRAELATHLRSLDRHLEGHVVETDVDDRHVVVDRSALRHIVTNLVSNAAKFSPTGSTIRIRAGAESDGLVISVADEGVGVPPEDRERIFELFRQSSREVTTARGTGVGLAIVKRYTELLEGRVVLESALGQGSTFLVWLPRTDAVEP